MSAHCDFSEQVNMEGDAGRLRPDMVVNLPNKKQIIIDAKAPLAAYLEALEARSDGEKAAHLKDHARQGSQPHHPVELSGLLGPIKQRWLHP